MMGADVVKILAEGEPSNQSAAPIASSAKTSAAAPQVMNMLRGYLYS
jgi:hypothetical protein